MKDSWYDWLPFNFCQLSETLHIGMKAQPTSNNSLLNEIAVDNGAKLSDILTVTIFSIYLAVRLWHAFKVCETGVALRHYEEISISEGLRLNPRILID